MLQFFLPTFNQHFNNEENGICCIRIALKINTHNSFAPATAVKRLSNFLNNQHQKTGGRNSGQHCLQNQHTLKDFFRCACANYHLLLQAARSILQKIFPMKEISFKKMILHVFKITETTDRGKKWKRVAADRQVKWFKMVKLSDYGMQAAVA